MSTAQPRRESAWQRFLDGKTPAQRLLLQVGAIATALAAIATLVISVGWFVSDRFGGPPGGDGPAVVRTQEKSADRFVEMLIKNDGGVVQLDHQIHGVLGPADVTLEYNCRASGTYSRMRVHLELRPQGDTCPR